MPRQAVDLIKLPGGHGVSIAAKNMTEDWQAMTEEVKKRIEKTMPSTRPQQINIEGSSCLALGIKLWCFYDESSFLWASITSCNQRSLGHIRL